MCTAFKTGRRPDVQGAFSQTTARDQNLARQDCETRFEAPLRCCISAPPRRVAAAMAVSPLTGLRGALTSLDMPLLVFAALRLMTRFCVWLTGADRHTPTLVRRTTNAAHAAALAAATVALLASVLVDDGKLLAEFEVCGPSTAPRPTGLVASALLFVYASSSSFFVVCASVLGLRLIAAGDTAAAFVAANLAVVDDSRELSTIFAMVCVGGFYSYVVQVTQTRYKDCGVRDTALLSAVAWVAAVLHMLRAMRAGLRALRA